MKWFWLGTSAMAVVTILALGFGGRSASAEDQIRAVLDLGVVALEAQDVGAAADLLHENYRDKDGRTKSALKGLSFMALRRGPVFISLTDVKITVPEPKKSATTATAAVQGLVLQGTPEIKVAKDLIPTRGRAFDVTVQFFRVDDDEWQVTAIDGISASFID
jgi:hypothetical protein